MRSSAPPARHSRGPILVEIGLAADFNVDRGAVRVARRVALRQATGLDPNIEHRMRYPIEEARLDADLCRIAIGDGVARAIVALLLRIPSRQLASYVIGDQVMVQHIDGRRQCALGRAGYRSVREIGWRQRRPPD